MNRGTEWMFAAAAAAALLAEGRAPEKINAIGTFLMTVGQNLTMIAESGGANSAEKCEGS